MKEYLSFGGGVNSTALMLLLLDEGIEFESVFVNHGGDYPETYEYVTCVRNPYDLVVSKYIQDLRQAKNLNLSFEEFTKKCKVCNPIINDPDKLTKVFKFEQLNEFRIYMNNKFKLNINEFPKLNVTKKTNFTEFYTDKTAQNVYINNEEIFTKFGYCKNSYMKPQNLSD